MSLKKYIAAALALCLILLGGCSSREQADPYAGMVQVPSGYGTQMWVKLHEDVPVSDFAAEDFADGEYVGTGYICAEGIDVSEHQGLIDWEAVAAEGVDFAIIRAGYRGYSEGGLFVDKYFFENMNGAVENGIDIGIYFFSQATSVEEAVEEAQFLMGEMLSLYVPETFSLPIFFDWETIGIEAARTDNVDGTTLTDCAIAFCDTIRAAGYEAGIYAYRNLGYYSYELPRLTDYTWWIAALGDFPDFYYKHSLWQYSVTGQINGIAGDVDRNMMFTPIATQSGTTE